MPRRPLESHLRISQRSERNSTTPYPPPGENISTSVMTDHVDDYVHIEEEVEWALQRLQGHRLGGPYRVSTNHLWEWLWEHQAAETEVEEEEPTAP